ncbi:MAG: chloride channel protein [Paracoccaceae bacterium]
MTLRHRLRKGVFRRSRALVSSPRLWRSRLVFWTGALATGLVSVLFAVLADHAQGFFQAATSGGGWHRWLPLLLTPLGMVACAVLADRYFPGSQGSGIPQAIAARHLRTDEERDHLLSLRLVLGKVGLTIAGLASGASIGREGPTVQVGASLMLMSARVGGMSHARGLILAGSAAGIAAAFNTPLAGIVFAIEEMSRSYQARTTGVILSAVIIAGVASLAFLGNYSYFGVVHDVAEFPGDWLLVVACGVVGGFFGALFSRAVLWLTRRIRNLRAVAPLTRLMLVALAAGLMVAGLGIATDGMTFGTSYDQARDGIEGATLPWYFFPAKLLATLASTVAGIPGGLFAPSLAVGAGLGSILGALLGSSAGLAAVLGMSGYFAGVVQAPMTAFVIILEMTGNHANVVAIMASAMLGYGTARLVAREPLYHTLSRLWAADVLRKVRAQQAARGEAEPVSG